MLVELPITPSKASLRGPSWDDRSMLKRHLLTILSVNACMARDMSTLSPGCHVLSSSCVYWSMIAA